MIRALDDPDASVRAATMNALMYLRDPRALGPLKRFTSEAGIGHVASEAIKHIHDPRGYAWWPADKLELWQLCQDAHTLKGHQFGDAERYRLVIGLNSANGTIVSSCLLALGALDARDVVPAIFNVPASETKFHVLAQLGTAEAVEYLIQQLSSTDRQIRELTIAGMASGADRWAAPLLISLLDDPSLDVEQKRMSFGKQDLLLNTRWPRWHKGHAALFQFFGRFGLQGMEINLAAGQQNDVSAEIVRLKAWWQTHGQDFIDEKSVPNPNLTMMMYIDL